MLFNKPKENNSELFPFSLCNLSAQLNFTQRSAKDLQQYGLYHLDNKYRFLFLQTVKYFLFRSLDIPAKVWSSSAHSQQYFFTDLKMMTLTWRRNYGSFVHRGLHGSLSWSRAAGGDWLETREWPSSLRAVVMETVRRSLTLMAPSCTEMKMKTMKTFLWVSSFRFHFITFRSKLLMFFMWLSIFVTSKVGFPFYNECFKICSTELSSHSTVVCL